MFIVEDALKVIKCNIGLIGCKPKRMGTIKGNIPNFITCLNLVCGFVGIVLILQDKLVWAVYAIFLAAIFDFLDGLIARILGITSTIGKDLDSLADIITFGVLPGLMIYKLINIYPSQLLMVSLIETGKYDNSYYQFLPYFAVLIPVCSAIRLARFNNDSKQNYSFKGLPTPANGLLIASFFYWSIYSLSNDDPILRLLYIDDLVLRPNFMDERAFPVILQPFILCFFTILLSYLLISNIKFMAFKFKNFSVKDNLWKYTFLVISLLLIIFLEFASAPIILILYILISQIHFRTHKHEI